MGTGPAWVSGLVGNLNEAPLRVDVHHGGCEEAKGLSSCLLSHKPSDFSSSERMKL